MSARRRRALLLLAVALASGGLAASQVHDRERRAAAELGPLVDVLVAARDLPAGARVGRGALRVARVPARFAPPDALGSAAAVVGARVAVPVRAGGYLGAGVFAGAEAGGGSGGRSGGGSVGRIGRGRRVVTVEAAGAGGLAGLAAGARVDVLVSTETGAGGGGGRTVMALAGAELVAVGSTTGGESGGDAGAAADLAVTPGAAADLAATPDSAAPADSAAAGPAGRTLATLLVTLRQAIYLTAADNFAREIRLLPRPPGDRSAAGAAVAQSQL
ncbi:MAG: pilus assembly protein CpaB [Thermoleophilaceae bacterium]|nr:pilus assembly protein CpaB [Thermoleophilaceae bacterium]